MTLEFGICKRGSVIMRDDEETQYLLCGREQREQNDINKGMNTIFSSKKSGFLVNQFIFTVLR